MLTVVKRSRLERRDWVPCMNGCIACRGAAEEGWREATHYAWIIGHKVPLCTPCAVAWQEWWSEALARRRPHVRNRKPVAA